MVAMASDVKLDLSMRIESRGDHANAAFAAEVSVVAAKPCAVDGAVNGRDLYERGARAENR